MNRKRLRSMVFGLAGLLFFFGSCGARGDEGKSPDVKLIGGFESNAELGRPAGGKAHGLPGSQDAFTEEMRVKLELPIAELTSKPTIDGSIDESCWKAATRLKGFVNTFNGNPVSEATVCYAGHDQEYLYFAFICKESQIDKINKKYTQHDSPVSDDDCIEIFVQTGQVPGKYYHFVVNALGTQRDEAAMPGLLDVSWTKEWQAKAVIGKDGWTVEVAIPFCIFDYDAGAKFNWKINLCREEGPRGELSALFPTFGGFHNPEKFGRVTGLNLDLSKYYYRIANLSLGDGKLGANVASFDLKNETSSTAGVEIEKRLVHPSGRSSLETSACNLKPGSNPIRLQYDVNELGEFLLSFRLIDSRTKELLYDSSPYAIATPEPIAFRFLEPYYRNCIFASQDLTAIIGEISLNIQESLKAKATLRVSLLNDAGAVIKEKNISVKGTDAKLRVEFPTAGLKVGKYTLQTTLLNGAGEKLVSHEEPLWKLAPAANEVRVDKDNNMLINNQPFFPLGMWYGDYQELKEAGFNTTVEIGGFDPSLSDAALKEGLGKQYAQAKESDMYIVTGLYFLLPRDAQPSFDSFKASVRKKVMAVKDLPNLLAYELLDEPNIDFAKPPQNYRDTKIFLDANDPYHPAFITQCGHVGLYPSYRTVCDVNGIDFYPGFKKGGDSFFPISTTANQIKQLREGLKDAQPIWLTAQSYDKVRTGNPLELGRLANYRETRCIAYSSIIEGAKGLFFWPYDGLGSYGDVMGWPEWYGIKAVVKELGLLSPVFLAPDFKGEVTASIQDSEAHFRVKEYKGDLYILIANSSKAERKLGLALPELNAKRVLKVIGEEREVKIENGRFQDDFGKYVVHLYSTAAKLPPVVSIKATEAEADRRVSEAREKNLKSIFFRLFDAGNDEIQITASSGVNFYFTVDGMRSCPWHDTTPKEWPDWLELKMKHPQKIGRIVIYTSRDAIRGDRKSSIKSCDLQSWEDGAWKTIEKIINNSEIRIERKFAPRAISRLRILVQASNDPTTSYIDEVEAYEN